MDVIAQGSQGSAKTWKLLPVATLPRNEAISEFWNLADKSSNFEKISIWNPFQK